MKNKDLENTHYKLESLHFFSNVILKQINEDVPKKEIVKHMGRLVDIIGDLSKKFKKENERIDDENAENGIFIF